MKLTWPVNKYDDAVYQDEWCRCFYDSFLFDWSVEPGILLLQPRGWSGTGNGTFLSIKSILRCSFFPQILKRLSTWLAFGQEQRISDCHSPSSHIQDLVRPFSTPGFIRDFKQALPKMLLTTPPPPSPRQTGTMGSFFWTLFFPLRWTLWH